MRVRSLLLLSASCLLTGCGDPPAAPPVVRGSTPAAPPAEPPLVPPADADALRRLLRERGLRRVADALVALAQPCARLLPRDGAVPAGPTTRLGGDPELPPSTAWPHWKGLALSFLGQLRLEEMPVGVLPGLPTQGVLSFFWAVEGDAFGLAADDRGAFQVLYSPDASVCVKRPAAMGQPGLQTFASKAMVATPRFSLPTDQHGCVAALGLDDTEADALGELVSDMHFEGPGHQLGGFDMPLQNVVEGDLGQRIGGGLPQGKPWRLLLQLESDAKVDPAFMWGDVGTLYFLIHPDDLAAARFDRIWMEMQCH